MTNPKRGFGPNPIFLYIYSLELHQMNKYYLLLYPPPIHLHYVTMANTGLFRLFFLFGLVFCSAVARSQPDTLSSRYWINSQKYKRSQSVVSLTHTVGDDSNGPVGLSHTNFPPRQVDPSLKGDIILTGPAERLSDFHQVSSFWRLVGCTTKATPKQTVLAYCTSKNPEVDCGGIFVSGAKHTIVSLPDGCGASPFGRVVKFEPTKRKLPVKERKEIGKKSFSVFELTFDYDFKAIPHKKGEPPVQMTMQFTNSPGRLAKAMGASAPGKSVNQGISNYDIYQNNSNIPFDKDFSGNIASMSQQCSGFTMGLDIEAQGTINGTLSYGYYVTGTISPANIDEHYAFLTANAYVTTQLNMTGLIQYTFSLLTVPILPSVGLPGLSYPGLLTIGPYFEINAGISGNIAVDGSMTTNTGFSIPTVDISIGNSSTPTSDSDGTDFADVLLSKNIQVSAGLTFAVTPQVGVQINVLSGTVNADVSLQPSAGITAGGSANVNTQTGNVTDPCVELDGDLNLNWGVGGKLGPWGASVTGKIWGLQKKLWSQCFNNKKRSIGHESEWKQVAGPSVGPYVAHHATKLATLTCPAVNPFGDSSSPPPPSST